MSFDERDLKEKTREEEFIEDVNFNQTPTPLPTGFWERNFLPIDSKRLYDECALEFPDGVDPEEERKLVRKIDWVIMPVLLLSYCFYYIDKATLSYAAIFGLREDLKLSGTMYSTLGSIFYLGWLAWCVPGQFLLQKVQIGRYMGINIFLWGLFLAAQATVKTYHAEVALRFVSGMFEAVADPAFMAITTMYYNRREQPIRIGLWYCGNGIGTALGGLIGTGIGQINSHLANWRLEFLIVGLACVAWGITCFLVVPAGPITAWFLTPRERKMAVTRLLTNQTGIENRTIKVHQLKEAARDWKPYTFFLFAVSANVPSAGLSNYSTIIVKGLGFSTFETTLLQLPFGAFISLCILVTIFVNDRLPKNSRTLAMAVTILPNIAGTVSLVLVPQKYTVWRLLAYYATGISNCAFVLGLSLVTGNVGGQTKKMVVVAATTLGMCVGNIIGPYFYLGSQAPAYKLGFASMVFCNVLKLVLVLFMHFMFKRANRIRDAAEAAGEYDNEPSAAETAYSDLTDWENKRFRYVY